MRDLDSIRAYIKVTKELKTALNGLEGYRQLIGTDISAEAIRDVIDVVQEAVSNYRAFWETEDGGGPGRAYENKDGKAL